MRAYLLSTGDEIVRGRTLDRNAPEIARALADIGCGVVGMTTVGDDVDALTDAIRRAAALADVVVMTGGLGPTRDDCTRAAAAAAAGVALRRDAGVEAWLRERWSARGLHMPESNLLQADVPEGADLLPNEFGTAPGFVLAVGGARFFALPGPPREMRGMLAAEVLPRLRAATETSAHVVRTRTLETFGERESALGERIADLMARDAWPRVGTTADEGTIRVVVHAEGAAAEVDAALGRVEAELRRRLGATVFGVDGATLQEVVVAGLLRTRATLAVAESCTGGLVAGALTSVPGASAVFPGGVVTYSDGAKSDLVGVPADLLARHGAVSEEVVRAMAAGVRARFGAEFGLAVSGIAGPGGGTPEKPVGLVHLALDVRGAVVHRRVMLPGDRALVRTISVKAALDLVRRHL